MMVNVWLAAVAAIYSSVMAAYDRFVVARSIDMVILLLRTLGTIYVFVITSYSIHYTKLYEVVMFFLSPYVVGKLDAVAYGIWSLLTVLTGYMGIFDLGVRASVGRHIALYLGKKDKQGVDETIRAGFGFFSLTVLVILAVAIFLGWSFPVLFKGVPPEYYYMVRILLPIMMVNVWLRNNFV